MGVGKRRVEDDQKSGNDPTSRSQSSEMCVTRETDPERRELRSTRVDEWKLN